MNEIQLSKRLEKVASYVRAGSSVADIGSDHAYLPVHLVSRGIARRAIAGEVNKGPLTTAIKQIKKNNLEAKIHAKLGNGLEVIEGEEVDTVTICGMGGPLISQILEEGKGELSNVSRLILQPNIAADHVRRFLLNNQWELKDESILKEDGHIYEILMAEKGKPLVAYSDDLEKELWLGPFLLKKKSPEFMEKWSKELEQLEIIYEKLNEAAPTEELMDKRESVKRKMDWLKEVLK
ncbi:tRNA (adenine22-N1)-methyltransferase [Evansella vedderi]|uniref:tRNA (Adenine22-N1)-methyltransferase n=1 Tax=Evansella vedderi TaxID=38282 RepID=A0ABT9ZT49_9BACI|nr:tRNA (adenine(22)-N(1))-methyltransferase TrmK [Evansella vedderi]MDQ0254374.1 tRNA (adenine22-N1)-methyltransferase [Evansella vedderi]